MVSKDSHFIYEILCPEIIELYKYFIGIIKSCDFWSLFSASNYVQDLF